MSDSLTITGLIISPWAESEGPMGKLRYPKVYDDYTLFSCRQAGATSPAGSFTRPAQPGERAASQADDPAGVACEIVCDYGVWEAIVHDPEYKIGWYEEAGRPRRVMGS